MTLWRDEGEKRVGKHLWLCGVCADGMAGAVGSGEFCFWTPGYTVRTFSLLWSVRPGPCNRLGAGDDVGPHAIISG